ncbi:MCE family protein [Enterobacter sp. RHBSTW-00994]|uniref:PqiB family protein n=1 Tax=Enterobacter sp. RHBSTW-00994 TaxID=2742676 RepID=UPI0015EA16C1|nr:MlaD family protein [Enterobacter sp. RHBSTW-00994]QLR43536.1 MCE family protein [Enterobacter sp. RHBSTW-00994]
MKRPVSGIPLFYRGRWRNAFIWLLPVVAFIVAVSMVIQARLSVGPEVVIAFRSAAGLEAGKTAVKYKDVTVGLVKAITLSPDNTQVLVRVALGRDAQNLTRADTRFWVVRPRVGMSGVSGIDTLLSGAYIGVDRGQSDESQYRFTGLEIPPAIVNGMAGSQFKLEADDLGSLDINSPVYYRRIPVGRITSYQLRKDGRGIDLNIFIDAPYDRLVTADSRFWNVSGVDLSVGSDGFQLKTQTVAAIMAGGIAFSRLDNPTQGGLYKRTRYKLAPDQETAMAPADGPPVRFQLRFEHPLHGLNVGAPVEFSSVRIGHVASVELDYNPEGYRFPTIVDIDVYPSRMGNVLEKLPKPTGDTDLNTVIFTREMIAHGLRAKAAASSLLTGQLYISLDFVPDAPEVNFDAAKRPVELPTVNGGLTILQDQLTGIARKINKMPLDEIGNNMNTALVELNKTLRMVNNQSLPAANHLMQQAQQTTQDAQKLLAEDSPLVIHLLHSLQEATRTLRAVRSLTNQLDRHPESLLQGRTDDVVLNVPHSLKEGEQP